jgi:hypothetical protein
LVLVPTLTGMLPTGPVAQFVRRNPLPGWLVLIALLFVVYRFDRKAIPEKLSLPSFAGPSPPSVPDLTDDVRQTVLRELGESNTSELALRQSDVRLQLTMEMAPDLLQPRLVLAGAPPSRPSRTMLSPTATLGDVFEPRRALLVLGGPGSGKTTQLLELARDLLAGADATGTRPLPVVLNLSSWSSKDRSLIDWMAAELFRRHRVAERLWRGWVASRAVLPLLDGLDEVREEWRGQCVDAINRYRSEGALAPLAVSSRIEEYEAVPNRLRLDDAVILRPPGEEELGRFLDRSGTSLAGLREALKQDTTLSELLRSPLMLGVAAVVYRDQPPTALVEARPEERRSVLLDAFVERNFEWHAGEQPPFGREQVTRWLSRLAQWMGERTVFYPEWIQPDHLISSAHQRLVTIGVALGCGLATGLVTAALSAFLVDNPLPLGAVVGAVTGWVAFSRSIDPVGTLTWSWVGLRSSMWSWINLGLRWFGLIGLTFGLIVGYSRLRDGEGVPGLAYGLAYGLLGGLVLGLLTGILVGGVTGSYSALEVAPGDPKKDPSLGIGRSGRNALAGGLSVGLIFAIFGVLWGLRAGAVRALVVGAIVFVVAGTVMGLRTGGRAYLQHLAVRALLVREDSAPWRYDEFLRYAVRLTFLQRVDAGYSFFHGLLQQHFAELPRHRPAARPTAQ